MTAIENATARLKTAYLGVHRVLDDDGEMPKWDSSVELSRVSSEIALAYTALTGETIGVALGWANAREESQNAT